MPQAQRREQVTVLDVAGNIASAKLVTPGWVDCMTLSKVNGEWKILSVVQRLLETSTIGARKTLVPTERAVALPDGESQLIKPNRIVPHAAIPVLLIINSDSAPARATRRFRNVQRVSRSVQRDRLVQQIPA